MRSASELLAPRRVTLGLALAALALSGCARDLELPGVPTRPSQPAFTPATAHAGERVSVTATHLEADPTANTVNFAHASARGERWEGDALVVRVPADAGDGPITVANRDGTSDPSAAAFDYLGLGEPRRIQVAAASPILQHPRAVHAVGGDLVLDSTLYGGLVWAGNAGFTTPAIVASAAAPWEGANGALYFATWDELSATGTLSRIDAFTGEVVGPVALPPGFAPVQLVPMHTSNVLAVFGNVDGVEQVGAYELAALAKRYPPSAYGLDDYSFFGAADLGDGRIVLADADADLGLTLALLDLGVDPLTPPPGVTVIDPPPAAAGLTFAPSGLVPLAVGRATSAAPGVTAGAHLAAVALDDGNVAVADLDAPTPTFIHVVETWSAADVESIAAEPAGVGLLPPSLTSVAIATKPKDGLSIGIDLATGTLLWSVDANAPKVASVVGPLAFVANDGDNDVAVINLGTGSRIARVSFDVMPGLAVSRFADAAAFLPAASGVGGDLLFPSTAFPGLLAFPLDSGEAVALSRIADVASLAASGGARAIWAAAEGPPPRLQGILDGDASMPIEVELPAPPQRTAARDLLVVVGHDEGLSLIDGAAPPAVASTATIPGTGTFGPTILALGFTPAGDVWTLVWRDEDVQAQRWTTGAILAGGSPSASWTLPSGSPRGAAWLEDGLWIFYEDDLLGPVATLLDDSLAEVRTVPASADLTSLDAISPNGRLLVQREVGTTLGFLLRFFRADPSAGFPEVQTLVFSDRVTGFAFDATGERLFVTTQAPDRVVTID